MTIYKYLKPSRIDVLENLRICFSPPGSLNDPFECVPATELQDFSSIAREAAKRNIGKTFEHPKTGKPVVMDESIAELGFQMD